MNKFNSILLVDDEKDIREIIQEVLGDLAKKYWQASDGLEALKVVGDHPVDLVITDLAMPHMNGFELIRKLRTSGSKVPIFVLTGHADKLVANNLKSFGRIAFLSKPFDNDQLKMFIVAFVESLNEMRKSA